MYVCVQSGRKAISPINITSIFVFPLLYEVINCGFFQIFQFTSTILLAAMIATEIALRSS